MKLSKGLKITIIALFVLAGTGLVFVITRPTGEAPQGMREVKSYNPQGICQALVPSCGYCPNEPIHDKCYVQDSELE